MELDPALVAPSCAGVVINPAPTTCVFVADNTVTSGGTLTVTFATLSSDATIQYNSYVRKLNDDGNPIIPLTGGQTTDVQPATLTATEVTGTLSKNSTVTARSHFIEKSVTNVSDTAPTGNSPGDTLEYTTTLYISDYFSSDSPQFDFELSDGQDYKSGQFSVSVTEGASVQFADESTPGFPGAYLTVGAKNGGTGLTAFDLELANAMSGLTGVFTDAVVDGADAIGGSVTSAIVMKYQADISSAYNSVGGGIDTADVVSGKVLNTSTIDIVGGSGSTTVTAEADADIVKISALSLDVSHINGSVVGAAPYAVQNGDDVTFQMSFVIPAGGSENLKITNYLPGPMFSPTGAGACLTGASAAPPAVNNWDFGTNDPGLTYGDVTINCDVSTGTIEFDFDDIDTFAANQTVELFFTVTATDNPMVDGLKIIDSAYLTYENSFGKPISLADKTNLFDIESPNVTPLIKAVTTDDGDATVNGDGDVADIDALGLINYSLDLTNDGRVTAQDTSVTIAWPTGMINPNRLATCTSITCGYSIDTSTDTDCGGTPVITGTNETGITISGIDITDISTSPSNVCTITFNLLVDQKAQANQSMSIDTAVTWNVGGLDFPPNKDKAIVDITDPSLSFAFDSTGSAKTSPGTYGETTDWKFDFVVPEGTIENAVLQLRENGGASNRWVTFSPSATTVDVGTLFTQTDTCHRLLVFNFQRQRL